MRICLLGENRGSLDEGMRITTHNFTHYLSQNHQVLALDLRDIFSNSFFSKIRVFKPDIIHYLHGPTTKSFLITKGISLYFNSKTVMSSMRPMMPYLLKEFIPYLFKPDLILTQSMETENMFKRIGCKTEFLPSGVDTNKFKCVPKTEKEKLRLKYGINDQFVILHIGSIKKGRNIQLLQKLQDYGNVLIIGSSSTGTEPKIYREIVESGCTVWLKYIQNIEEIYAISDCYIYPTVSRRDYLGRTISDSIEMPLTVLEAMSCNLPVITTKFGALPRVFDEGNGLFFIEDDKDFVSHLDSIKKGIVNIKTREKVLNYSWENVGKKLEDIYISLINGKDRLIINM